MREVLFNNLMEKINDKVIAKYSRWYIKKSGVSKLDGSMDAEDLSQHIKMMVWKSLESSDFQALVSHIIAKGESIQFFTKYVKLHLNSKMREFYASTRDIRKKKTITHEGTSGTNLDTTEDTYMFGNGVKCVAFNDIFDYEDCILEKDKEVYKFIKGDNDIERHSLLKMDERKGECLLIEGILIGVKTVDLVFEVNLKDGWYETGLGQTRVRDFGHEYLILSEGYTIRINKEDGYGHWVYRMPSITDGDVMDERLKEKFGASKGDASRLRLKKVLAGEEEGVKNS